MLATSKDQARTGDEAARRQALHQRRDRHDQHAAAKSRQSVQGRDALRNNVRVRRKQVVGQGFPIRKLQHFEAVAGKYRNLRFQRMRGVRIAGDHDDEAGMATPGFSQGERQRRAVRRVPLPALFGAARQAGLEQCGMGHRFDKRRQRQRWRASSAGREV